MNNEEFMQWIKETNKVIKKANYRVIYLPDDDLMPYEHLGLDTELSNEIGSALHLCDRLEEDEPEDGIPWNGKLPPIQFTREKLETMQIALMIYKTVLMEVHNDEVKAGIRRVIEALGKKQKEDEKEEK